MPRSAVTEWKTVTKLLGRVTASAREKPSGSYLRLAIVPLGLDVVCTYFCQEPFRRCTEYLMSFLLLLSPGEAEDFVANLQEFGIGSDLYDRPGGSVTENLGVLHEQPAVVLMHVERCGCGPFNTDAHLVSLRLDGGHIDDAERLLHANGRDCFVHRHYSVDPCEMN